MDDIMTYVFVPRNTKLFPLKTVIIKLNVQKVCVHRPTLPKTDINNNTCSYRHVYK